MLAKSASCGAGRNATPRDCTIACSERSANWDFAGFVDLTNSNMSTWLLILVLFVVSPVALHVTRLASILVVAVLLSAAYLVRTTRLVRFRIESIALAFLVLMTLNAAIAVLSGNGWVGALNELIPVLEVFLCFVLVSRVRFDELTAAKWLRWILWFVLARAAWQLLLVSTGSPVIPPIYGQDDRFKAEVITSNFAYVRPIDPIAGLFVAMALILYVFGIHRRLSLWIVAVAGAVSLLGLTRSEWIASTGCLVMLLAFTRRKMLRQAIFALLTLALAVYVLTVAVPEFGEFVQTRLFEYTAQQIDAPTDELQALRFLEFDTAAEKFRQAPVLGHGLGSGFGTVVFNGSDLQFVQFHNYYLNLLANAGLVGLLVLVLVVYCAAKFGIEMYKASAGNLQRAIVLCAMGSLLWWGIFVAFQPIYSSYHVTILVGTFFGMAQALSVRKGMPNFVPLRA